MSAVAGAKLLEREAELDDLHAALESARGGTGGLVVVEGAAGIGKTRLLQAARQTAERTGMRVLRSRGSELERDFPFALVRQLFEPALLAVDTAEREDLLAGAARLAGPVVGVESGDAAGEAGALPIDPSFPTLNALYWLVANLAEARPLLLVVDDAHWADQPSLRFFGFLFARLEELPVLLVLAARPSEPGAAAELLVQLTADPAARVIRPRTLSPPAVANVIRDDLTPDAHDEFCAACHEATAGNPFMLRELIRELAADRSRGTASETVHVRRVAPATIQRAVLVRLGRLPEPAPRLAQAVAVLGDDAETRQVAELAGVDRDAAAAAADALAVAGILEPGSPWRFIHPLVRNAVYADLPAAARSATHREAARLLMEAHAEPERIAVHLLATEPEADRGVVETLGAAARRALDRAAPEAAIAYVRRALAEPPDSASRRDLLRDLMTASLFTMDRQALEHLGSEIVAEISADSESLLASAPDLAPLLCTYGRAGEGLALLERGLAAAIDAGDYDLVMRFEGQIVMWARLRPDRQAARWNRYRKRIQPDTPGERLSFALEAFARGFAGEPAATVAELARRAVEGGAIFREQRDGVLWGIPIYMLIRADELDTAERAIQNYAVEAAVRGASLIAGTAFLRGDLHYARGNIAQAEPDMRAAVEAARQGGFLTIFPNWIAGLVDVLVERGELDAAERELEASGLAGDVPDNYWLIPLLYSRGCLRLAQGRTVEGLADLGQVGTRSRRCGIRNVALGPAVAVAAIAFASRQEVSGGLIDLYRQVIRDWGTVSAVGLGALGKGRPERGLAELYLRGARQWGTPRVIGIGLHALGVVEGGEKGIGLMREAVATLERSPARLEHARALTDLGAALRRANRRAEAREPLRSALEMASSRGALAVAKRAHEELEATGEKLRPLLAGGVESLTPSERRVAEMAAEGLSNKEIAQQLFLTVKTVETHLSHAYRKLDIRSRSELGQALATR